ncbi:hypothetical protein WN55_06435 [Dufourea novaeangliae]|uniref:Uncharacterized protein n=1 Tax=Dufourea novaeangliae TaxID=178035 RepID=A0A154P0L7_DUFNO|nr:hypothetical protein WN55_06435 [Dufourea novaeangliae]
MNGGILGEGLTSTQFSRHIFTCNTRERERRKERAEKPDEQREKGQGDALYTRARGWKVWTYT